MGEPPEEPPAGPPEASPEGPGEELPEEPPGDLFSEPPEPPDELFETPAHGPLETPTGELFEEPSHGSLEAPTGELFEHPDDDDVAVHPTGELLGDLGEEVHSAAELAQRRAQERAQRRRAGRQRLLVLIAGVVVVVVIVVLVTSGGSGPKTTTTATSGSPLAAAGAGAGALAAGSSASALSGNILVADRNNGRLVVISPLGQTVWTDHILGPSDAYLSGSGRSIVVTQHGAFVVLVVGVKSRKIDFHYGHAGKPGTATNRLHDPQTAQLLSNGQLLIDDKSNCRILFIVAPHHHPVKTLGKPGNCVHNPPATFAYPDAAFPTSDGGLVVTELTPGWVDVLSKSDALLGAQRIAGLSAPYDANEYASGELIATSHSKPGAVEEFTSAGKVLWSYAPASGPGELDEPSLAQVLPNGDVLVSDSGNDRIVIISPQKKIVWQYGHTHKPGSAAGYLHTPDSAVLVP